MGAMGMKFVGPVKIESADPGSKTVKIKANTREVGGQSSRAGARLAGARSADPSRTR
jgi:hypothetical protein